MNSYHILAHRHEKGRRLSANRTTLRVVRTQRSATTQRFLFVK